MINNETISIHFATLDKLCELFDCEPGDIIVREKHSKKEVKNK